ncbi:hypothetical protein L1276_004482 [Flavobacterium sp. HSC-32F16]|uniref:hypothetical protein n=1 Tax=Flavobacterium sp. HSC-32F16 TaxID=2910964 RepID=UPI0020A470FD|nr:hypothetical protein [Flavobacterium sp. HSC-32F16]MCP2029298.1 hypothetical protein [Flavobacterium sp. HSC-32F16]
MVSDDIKLSLPGNYYFQTQTIEKEYIDKDSKIGKIDLASIDNYDLVQIFNSLFIKNNIGEEEIMVIKNQGSNLLNINDLKKDYRIETIYYQDKNSLVFSDDDTFTTVHFDYDLKTKSYLIYTGSVSWTKKFNKEEKLDLAFYFLRNAKNLLSNNLTEKEFTWKDYIENRPKIEINLMKYFFNNFKKEIDVFLSIGESSEPAFDDYSMIKLYRINQDKEAQFYQYLNNLAEGKPHEAQQNAKWASKLLYTDKKCTLIPKENSNLVEIISQYYNGEDYAKEFMVFSIINKNNKSFILKSNNDLNEKSTDFYVKMFNYYSKNNTLDLSNKK